MASPLVAEYAGKKRDGMRIAALTAYDYPTARILDEAGVDVILVGDSLGMVVLGLPDTTGVTLEMMEHHCAAAARGVSRALLVCDLPIHTYTNPAEAVANARRLRSAGAHAVKLEGPFHEQIAAIVAEGIPVMAHLGMLPQSVREEGGYKIKGKTEEDEARLLQEALTVQDAGAFAVVLELVTPQAAGKISRALSIPTIGIGSGLECDGQVLVVHDLIGAFPWFRPKFVKPLADVASSISEAAREFCRSVRHGS
jgi:3-methyl-2-oxobutanoate hydroxymethyltransferase